MTTDTATVRPYDVLQILIGSQWMDYATIRDRNDFAAAKRHSGADYRIKQQAGFPATYCAVSDAVWAD